MSKKVYYIYNPTVERYERVYPSRRARRWVLVRRALEVVAVGIILFIGAYSLFEFPREKQLQEENHRLHEQLQEFEQRLSVATEVMNNLAERDNNFYRVIMHLDPVTASRRYAGMENALLAGFGDEASSPDIVSRVNGRLDLLERQIYMQSKSFDEIVEAIGADRDRLDRLPSIMPISELALKQMASGYGWRVDPIYGTARHHDGMDFASAEGTPVYATARGTVKEAGWRQGYGNCIDIDHGDGYMTRYAHLSAIKVTAGQKISRGDLIGLVGSTGKSTGPHLHYEVRYKGVPQNPVNYYFGDLTPEEYALMVEQSENAGHVMD